MRMKGLEPPRRQTLDPKSSAATNYATCANLLQSYKLFVTFATVEVNLSELNFVTIIRQIVAIVSQTKARRPRSGLFSSSSFSFFRTGSTRSSSTKVRIADANEGHAWVP